MSALELEKYGIAVTLPPRWHLVDVSEKHPRRLIAEAVDTEGRAHIRLYVAKAKKKRTIKDWMCREVRKQNKRFRRKHRVQEAPGTVTYTGVREVQTGTQKTPQTITVERYRISFTALHDIGLSYAYVAHRGYYFYLFVFNDAFYAPARRETVEEVIVPGMSFL